MSEWPVRKIKIALGVVILGAVIFCALAAIWAFWTCTYGNMEACV
jgi:hypothetical protein